MKLLFLTPTELECVIEEILEDETNELIRCQSGFSEEKDTDIVKVMGSDKSDELPIENLIPRLNRYYGVHILGYDVYEVGYFGEGFSFAIL
ncbi:hypothetical protein PP175_26235 (plasmid) [Aneurinibacillus sp. Ricciae_BoGa-3]|uniref:hypothetical protein n=1 Tax=Aneurinibacillus sp. Ricciae_BoGa-3 TaxID=3022697 RepID=UPI0023417C91|nr:hypothetical protein [Aneurinibacillus sp. Ricciae_BoGa-3]WCK57567.1 hypothetical protein PP175_26235 [Aneurinibacillus sp. Ricciae_BoGa-3]